MTEDDLKQLVAAGETDLVEFKRNWHDFSKREGKAAFVKDVLALANTCSQETPGRILFGVRDIKDGGGFQPISTAPTIEDVLRVLADFTQPRVAATLETVFVGGQRVDVLIVSWSPYRPHHSMRDVDRFLERNALYVRHGSENAKMTIDDMEIAFRDKDARLGRRISAEPLQIGFVEIGDGTMPRIVARIANVSEEPVNDVDASFEIVLREDPSGFNRERRLLRTVLAPGESCEIELRLDRVYLPHLKRVINPSSGDRWLDIILWVRYRARTGFLREMAERVHLAG
jgi:hypothetical protein